MVTFELTDFIKKSREIGESNEKIKSDLLSGGWNESDINEALNAVMSSSLRVKLNIYDSQLNPPLEVNNISLAGFWIRVVASLIDTTTYVIIFMIFNVNKDDNMAIFIFGLILISYVVVMIKQFGATLGKIIVGIKIISENGKELTWWKIILREVFGKFVSSLLLFIGYLAVGLSAKKQGFHDLIARTLVVYK